MNDLDTPIYQLPFEGVVIITKVNTKRNDSGQVVVKLTLGDSTIATDVFTINSEKAKHYQEITGAVTVRDLIGKSVYIKTSRTVMTGNLYTLIDSIGAPPA